MPGFFKRNPRFERELQKDPAIRDKLRDPAKVALSAAQSATPARMNSGWYVEDTDTGVRIGTTNPFFHLIEWGSVNNSPRAPLRRAVRAAGARLEETGP